MTSFDEVSGRINQGLERLDEGLVQTTGDWSQLVAVASEVVANLGQYEANLAEMSRILGEKVLAGTMEESEAISDAQGIFAEALKGSNLAAGQLLVDSCARLKVCSEDEARIAADLAENVDLSLLVSKPKPNDTKPLVVQARYGLEYSGNKFDVFGQLCSFADDVKASF